MTNSGSWTQIILVLVASLVVTAALTVLSLALGGDRVPATPERVEAIYHELRAAR